MIVFSLIVGLLGVILNFNVVRGMDWHSKPYSFYRHFQFVLAARAALTWSYCLIGASMSNPIIVLTLGCITMLLLMFQMLYGSERMCAPFECLYEMLKYKVKMYLIR